MTETDDANDIRKQLTRIEESFNGYLELLQNMVAERGDAVSEDPEYTRMYADAQALQVKIEALQERLAALEAAGQAEEIEAPPAQPIIPEEVEPSEAPGVEAPTMAMPEAEQEPQQVIEEEAPPAEAEVEAPPPQPPPKMVTVTRTRTERLTVFEQTWSFTGIASNVSQVVADLAEKGGLITDVVLQKEFGKVTFVCPFKVEMPVAMFVSAHSKRGPAKAGMIYYPNEVVDSQVISSINQLIQQFLASGAPRGYTIVFLQVNPPKSDENTSIVVGGLPDGDRTAQALENNVGNIYFDNDVFYKGPWIDEIKTFGTKLGLRVLSMIAPVNVFQNPDKFQMLVGSF